MCSLLRQLSVGEMRLMPAPLYRYTAPDQDVADGALFAFTLTNDPEVIVSLAAVRSGSVPAQWECGFCRMNSSPQSARMMAQVVWSVAGYWDNPRTAQDPYVEQWDADLPEELKLDAKK